MRKKLSESDVPIKSYRHFKFKDFSLFSNNFTCNDFFHFSLLFVAFFVNLIICHLSKMSYTDQDKASFVVKFIQENNNYAQFKTRVRRDARNGRARVPSASAIKAWFALFLSRGSIQDQRGQNRQP